MDSVTRRFSQGAHGARGAPIGSAYVVAAIAVAAIAARVLYLGQPILNIDEQFYLLVGDRMLTGAWPYVDIWDRKPPVLFAIHAAIRLLGGDGIWQAQIAAIVCVIATGVLVNRLALRLTAPTGALAAGVAYGWWTALAGGAINQAGAFFNLPMAAAALLLVQLIERGPGGGSLLPRALGAMLLAGLAVQIKQSAVFEAAFFGLTVAVLAWRALPPLAALRAIALAATAALLPSLVIVAIWSAAGHLDALVFATVTSATLRTPMEGMDYAWHLGTSLLMVLPLCGFAAWSIRHGARDTATAPGNAVRIFLIAWLAVALLSLGAYDRTFYDHYLLGLLVPASILAAPAFGAWRCHRAALAVTALALVGAVAALQWAERGKTGGWKTIAALDAVTRGQRNCPFSYGGPAVAYAINRWCTPTRYAFAGHLVFAAEAPAIGADSVAEVRRILATRPDRVVIHAKPLPKGNLATRALVVGRLARDYTLLARIEPDGLLVYGLRAGLVPLPNAVTVPASVHAARGFAANAACPRSGFRQC